MTQICLSCERPVSGRFCSHCGTPATSDATCRACAAALAPGARFCNMCGEPIGAAATEAGAAAPRSASSPWPWVVTAVAVLALLVAVLLPRFRGDTAQAVSFAPAAAGMGGAGGVDLAAMTPREAADRLFDRIMRAASAGDTAQALQFVPMALDAYERVEPDADARYHVGVLHLLAGDPAAARAQAEAILADAPTHLFGLFTAAQAARAAGDTRAALDFYQRFLEHYPAEIARDLPEYSAHAAGFPEMRAEAQAFVQEPA